jgi:photosynthetic reaction center cytochrome c subunit
MKITLGLLAIVVTALLTVAMIFTAGWTRPPVHSTQTGFRGLGLEQISNPRRDAQLKLANALPEPIYNASPDGQKATEVYKNVKVLNDLSADQFNRLMLAITEWVSPQQGCAYCHNVENLADDAPYTKVVARRMLQMTRHLNQDWKPHVAATGVTCYTCHRGNPVPANIWYTHPGRELTGGFAPTNHGMGHPNAINGSTDLSVDPYTPLLDGKVGSMAIRVISKQALPTGFGASIQTTEQTYSLMMAMSNALGVNCLFCHNSRAFSNWPQSAPQRVIAWHGIQLVRELNEAYLDPLQATLPPNRLGPLGDSPKVNCATCHQGASKPLLGVSMAKDYLELGGSPAP